MADNPTRSASARIPDIRCNRTISPELDVRIADKARFGFAEINVRFLIRHPNERPSLSQTKSKSFAHFIECGLDHEQNTTYCDTALEDNGLPERP